MTALRKEGVDFAPARQGTPIRIDVGANMPDGPATLAPPDPDKSACPSPVPEILRTLGYADDFIAEVCGIVGGDTRLRDRINLKIVRDAALLADSEEQRIRAAAAPLDAAFLASFLPRSARRFAEHRVLLGNPTAIPPGAIRLLKILPDSPSFFPD